MLRTTRILLACVGAMIVAAVGLTAQPAGAAPPGYYDVVNRQANECLDVTGAAMHHGADVAIWQCVGAGNQAWRLLPVTGTEFYQIQVLHSGMCLDVAWVSQTPGANVLQATCTPGQLNQHWKLSPVGGVWYEVTARHSGQCLDKAWADVVQYPCHGNAYWQHWRLR